MNEIAPIQIQSSEAIVTTPMAMLNVAVARGDTVLAERLMDLAERWDKTQARKAFDNAMAAAKAEIPTIRKNREVDYTTAKGRTNYKFEDLGEIARTIDPILARNGLSYRFRTSSAANEPIGVTCIISHRDGHAEENTLCAGRDDSGSKNSIQAIGSTLSYLQRYTLKAALGLAASADDDGNAAGDGGSITDEQTEWLRTLVTEVNADITKFLTFMKVESLTEITTRDYDKAVRALEAKRAKR